MLQDKQIKSCLTRCGNGASSTVFAISASTALSTWIGATVYSNYHTT